MRLQGLIVTAYLSLASAHSDHPQPRLVGARRLISEVRTKASQQAGHSFLRTPKGSGDHVGVQKRQGGLDGQCGPGVASCSSGYCCSSEGWCGKGPEYCAAPDCQLDYGTGCDGNQKPSGASTANVARPKLGSVPYGGVGIYDCKNPGDIAVTFDDGPWEYTGDLLDKLQDYGAHVTFFVTGNNIGKGMINDPQWPWYEDIQRMDAEGHQVASHTWSHQDASAITAAQFQNQIIWNEIAINDIIGKFPTYIRPPFSVCGSDCESALAKLGYHIIYFDLDTEGYLLDSRTLIQGSKDIWDEAIVGSNPKTDSFLQIEHDIHFQTVYNLTDYIIPSLFAHGYRSVTVGECLGDPKENWYRAGP